MNGKPIKLSSLEHKIVDIKTYEDLYGQCSQSNILQSAAYGEAKSRVEGFNVERMAVIESDNPIAIYNVLLKSLPLIGKVARINRGPLCLQNGSPSPEGLKQLYLSIYEEWVLRKRCFLQIAPNVSEDLMSGEDFKKSGFIRGDEPRWQSGWLYLQQPEDLLRKGLLQKWRNMLNKSEKMGMELHPVNKEKDMEALLQEYDRFMKYRNFQSISSDLIMAVYRQKSDMLWTLTARKEGQYLGAIIIAKHGDSCTYLVGMTSEEGRKTNANYLLLWNGLIHCRRAGFQWFDVGGIDEINTPGISHFKKGLGIMPYRFVGEFENHRGLRYNLLSKLKRYYRPTQSRKAHDADCQKMDRQRK